ncbi:sigma-54-dependent Fis family transcriptional regulator [Sporomusa silvacetica]|nr:sigma 54-interacting transcriptional regulator [Sporomusa silvacetica]
MKREAERRIHHNHLDPIQTWTRLVEEKVIDTDSIQQEIASSWGRCISIGLDPLSPIKPADQPIVDSRQLLEQNENGKLLDIARPQMKQLYCSIKHNGHFIIILNVLEGVALEVFGDQKMLTVGERLGVTAFGSCSEKYLGTTSASVCTTEGRPFRVMTAEHFAQDMQEWCCSGAPIFDECGKLVAVLNVSNINYKVHYPHIVDLTTATARAIEAEIKFRKFHHMYYKTYHYLTSVLESIPEHLLLIDNKGKIEHLNSRAASILGKSQQDCVGKSVFDDFASTYTDRCLERNAELTWQTGKGTTVEFTSLVKTLASHNEDNGYVGMIKQLGSVKSAGTKASYTFSDIKYCSSLMEKVITQAKKAAVSELGILICGESGTGKELFAQSIHNHSHRSEGPFIAINCAALPKDLIQSELFGFEEGMFTGAKRGGNPGKFELAQGGTILLDEIGDMPLELQANLLRVVQEKAVMRIGGRKQIPLDVRIISATNKNIYSEVRDGRFRADLYYRLSVMTINIPALHDRKQDIEKLFSYFIEKHRATMDVCGNIQITPDALKVLEDYDWPGNVRELEHVTMVVLNNIQTNCATITIEDLPEFLVSSSRESWIQPQETTIKGKVKTLDDAEKSTIMAAMDKCEGNITKTAITLGITRATLYRKLKNMPFPMNF